MSYRVTLTVAGRMSYGPYTVEAEDLDGARRLALYQYLEDPLRVPTEFYPIDYMKIESIID